MENKGITIKQAVDILREQGYELRMGSFESFENFKSYWDIHYAPLLKDIRAIGTPVAGFLADDLEKIFNN